jgi:hypothetical protein
MRAFVDTLFPSRVEEAGIGPLSLAKVKGIDPRPRAKEARFNSFSYARSGGKHVCSFCR